MGRTPTTLCFSLDSSFSLSWCECRKRRLRYEIWKDSEKKKIRKEKKGTCERLPSWPVDDQFKKLWTTQEVATGGLGLKQCKGLLIKSELKVEKLVRCESPHLVARLWIPPNKAFFPRPPLPVTCKLSSLPMAISKLRSCLFLFAPIMSLSSALGLTQQSHLI